MARARNIKPGFFVNDELCELPALTRLLFIGLWCVADRAGRMLDRPKRIKLEVLPGDDCDVDAMLWDLHARGFIVRYQVNALSLIEVSNWGKHQRPHHTEKPSTYPPASASNVRENASKSLSDKELSTLTVKEPQKVSDTRSDTGYLIPDTGYLIPDTGTKDMSRSAEKPADRDRSSSPEVAEVFEHWRATMRKPRAALDDKRRKVIRAALSNGYTVGDLRKAIDGCALSAWHMGQNDRGTPYNGLELILRNAEKIDGFMTLADAPPTLNRTPTREEQRADFIAQLTGRAPTTDNDKAAGNDPFTIDV